MWVWVSTSPAKMIWPSRRRARSGDVEPVSSAAMGALADRKPTRRDDQARRPAGDPVAPAEMSRRPEESPAATGDGRWASKRASRPSTPASCEVGSRYARLLGSRARVPARPAGLTSAAARKSRPDHECQCCTPSGMRRILAISAVRSMVPAQGAIARTEVCLASVEPRRILGVFDLLIDAHA